MQGEPLYFRTNRVDSESAAFELEGHKLTFHVEADKGAHLAPPGADAKVTIAGVPLVNEGAAFVHGMVLTVAGRAYLYLEREPKESERLKKFGGELVAKDSVSDVSSVDDIYVMDDSEDETGSDVSKREDLRIQDSSEGPVEQP